MSDRARRTGINSTLWFSSWPGFFQKEPSLLSLTVTCPLLLTCLFIRIVQQSFKLQGAFTVSQRGDDVQISTVQGTEQKGDYIFCGHKEARWRIEIFNEMVFCLYSKTKLTYVVSINISSIWYLQHVCQNKPLKVFAKTTWSRTWISQTLN